MKKRILTILFYFVAFASSNAQWQQTNGLYSGGGGGDVSSLAVSGNKLFAGTWNGIYQYNDSGNNWTKANNGTNIWSMAANGSNIYAGNQGNATIHVLGQVLLSTDNGSNWLPIDSGLSCISVYALAVSGSNIFAGTGENGVFLSTNNGKFWTDMGAGKVTALAVSGANLLAGYDGGGVGLSTNNGTSWTAINTGLTDLHVFALAINGNNWFAGTLNGGVFLSSNNGSNWTAVNTGLKDTTIYCLCVSGNNLFAGTNGGGVFLSTNNGSNWAYTGLTVVRTLITKGDTLFAGTWGSGVFKADLSVITGVNQMKINKEKSSVYPNPAQDRITVELSTEGRYNLSMSNILGQVVSTMQFTGTKTDLDVAMLPKGVYFVQVSSDQSKTVKKVVIQ